MEVLLKKCKITLSIIKQLLVASEENIRTYNVLGWVLLPYKNSSYKKILLYDSVSNKLVSMFYPKDISEKPKGQDNRFELYYRNDFNNHYYHSFDTKEEQVQFHSVLNRVVSEAKEQGQIFY